MALFYFTVDHPLALWLLFALPLLLFTHLYFMHHARRKAILFGNFKTLERITGKKILTKNLLLLVLRLVIVTCLVFAAAGTTLWRIGEQAENDIVLVIDASASMATADMNGTRIEAARTVLETFVNELDARSNIGIVQYSGLPEIVTVPTDDRAQVRAGIAALKLKPLGGSDIAAGILTATNLLADKENGKVIVLLTDGVASLSLYEDNPIPQAISYARSKGVVIHTIGVGSQRVGSFVPGLEAEAIIFDEQNLRRIAEDTGGTYTWALDPPQLRAAFDTALGARERAFVATNLSGVLILIALGVVFVEWGLLNTRFRILP
jgi:Ca-activated chloride channel family protein